MAGSDKKRKRFKLPRKAVFAVSGGLLLVLTASAAAAYFMGGVGFLIGPDEEIYGVRCNLVDSVSFTEDGGERWVRDYVSVDHADGMARVRTALRVAKVAAKRTKADLVLVVVTDRAGPKDRALIRGRAIGARIVYVPHPARVSVADAPFSARYPEGMANAAGDFYGTMRTMPLSRIETMAGLMKKPFGCETPKVSAEKTIAKAEKKKPKAHA